MCKTRRFLKNKLGRKVPEEANLFGEIEPYKKDDKRHIKYITEESENRGKIVGSIEEAIRKAGLKDGMTISFHHHLRAGDYVLEMVMKVIAELGIKDLTLCVSSLTSAHECLIDYIRSGVVTGLETSGIRGKLSRSNFKGLHSGKCCNIQNSWRESPGNKIGGCSDRYCFCCCILQR